MIEDGRQLDDLFREYRAACPDLEASVDFMPRLWARIESRSSFTLVFERWARVVLTASAVACLLLAALNVAPRTGVGSPHAKYATYTDALSAETTLERNYYSEVLSPPDSFPVDFRQ